MSRVIIRVAILALSMPFMLVTVKAQEKSSPPVSVGVSVKSELHNLVRTVMASGEDFEYRHGFAEAVGLDKPMSAKVVMALIGREARKVHVIYETDEASEKRPFCVFLVRSRKTPDDVQERFFRLSLDGQLEKVITLRNKLDGQGKAMRAGRSKVEEDINSPEIQKIFKGDLKFWLKDWLKKQKKGVREAAAK